MSYRTLNVLRVVAALACFGGAGRYAAVNWGKSFGEASPWPFVVLLALGVMQLVFLDWACWGKARCKRK